MVVDLRNVARAKEFFRVMGMSVVTGSFFLGGFVGDRDEETMWLYEKVQGWAELVRTLLGVAYKHPQLSYDGLQN